MVGSEEGLSRVVLRIWDSVGGMVCRIDYDIVSPMVYVGIAWVRREQEICGLPWREKNKILFKCP